MFPDNGNGEEFVMLKITLAAALLAVAFAPPAFAANAMKTDDAMMMKCDDASMMKVQAEMDKVTDPAMKEMAMKEMDMAKDSMKAEKMDDCTMHIDGAMKAMTKG